MYFLICQFLLISFKVRMPKISDETVACLIKYVLYFFAAEILSLMNIRSLWKMEICCSGSKYGMSSLSHAQLQSKVKAMYEFRCSKI